MKMSIILLILSFVILNDSYSKVIVVSNVSGIPRQFNNMTTAIGSSSTSSGDTLMVYGTFLPIDPIYLSKKLVIIGAGTDLTTLSISILASGNGSHLSGFLGDINFVGGNAIRDITISDIETRSQSINFGSTMSNITIKNSIIRFGFNFGNATNILLSNNIIALKRTVGLSEPKIKNINNSSIVFKNNYFVYDKDESVFESIKNARFINNIFSNFNLSGISNSQFDNNLTYMIKDSLMIPFGDNFGLNNINNEDPEITNGNPESWTTDINLKLKASSPGNKAGSDGKDIGIYGGQFPWENYKDGKPNYQMTAKLPFVSEFNILLDPVGKNSNLRFEAGAINYNYKP